MIPVLRSLSTNLQQPVTGRIVTIGSSADCHLQLAGLPPRVAHLLYSQGTYMIQRLKQWTKPLTLLSWPVERLPSTLALHCGWRSIFVQALESRRVSLRRRF